MIGGYWRGPLSAEPVVKEAVAKYASDDAKFVYIDVGDRATWVYLLISISQQYTMLRLQIKWAETIDAYG